MFDLFPYKTSPPIFALCTSDYSDPNTPLSMNLPRYENTFLFSKLREFNVSLLLSTWLIRKHEVSVNRPTPAEALEKMG